MTTRTSELVLATALGTLALLFLIWFQDATQPLAAMLLFAGPPALLAIGCIRGSRLAAFWSGVLGLLWFCHGVMLAYDRADERGFALIEVALSLLIIVAASWPGLRTRFGNRRTPMANDR